MSGEHHTLKRPGERAQGPAVVAATAPVAAGAVLEELELPAAYESVSRARRFVKSFVTVCGIPHVGDDAEILVSELVTNAVQHAATPGCTLRLLLIRVGARLRIEVHDPSHITPRLKHIDLMEETGRGWFLVAVIADRHGTDQTSTGKSVWCEVTAWPQAEQRVCRINKRPR